ncbi:MAG: hypothetical protein DCC58_01935 [Chloroflexi bacterium]|nr:MAG: hypothetical protein DCC58_01935 [Chloroflexota bacterium]
MLVDNVKAEIPSQRSAATYSRWDGAQAVTPLTPEDVLEALADGLLTGSIEQGLDRALHRGLPDDAGGALAGLDALRDQMRAERRRLEESDDLRDALEQLAEQLRRRSGAADLDADASHLLSALAAQPEVARHVLARASAATRDLLTTHLESHSTVPALDSDDQLDATSRFAGVALDAIERLHALTALEGRVRRIRRVEDVADVDPSLVRALLGRESGDALERLARSLQGFSQSGYVRSVGRRMELSARALQHIGDELLSAIFNQLIGRSDGDHQASGRPHGHDLSGASRAYQFGDPLTLDLSRTVLQAVRRGGGTPVELDPADFTIFEREESARAATVLAIDISRSMGERGYLLAAKKLALALSTLVRARFPRDRLLLVAFSDTARSVTPADLPRLSWDRFGYGTNVQDALRLARSLLSTQRGQQRAIILLTDGEPTAHRDDAGQVHFSHPATQETIARTYAEAERCRRDGISLSVCVLSDQAQVVRFAQELTRRGAGHLISAHPDTLAASIVLQYGRARRAT